jgi:hypothetical protein
MDGGGGQTQVNVYVDGELYAQKVINKQFGATVLATAGSSNRKG